MKLTEDILAKFFGGDIEVQSVNENYCFRGRIKAVEVKNNVFTVKLEWLAENEGGSSNPSSKWKLDKRVNYEATLDIYSVSDIGEGRLMLNSVLVGENVVLFPKGGSQLDPSKVKGLELT